MLPLQRTTAIEWSGGRASSAGAWPWDTQPEAHGAAASRTSWVGRPPLFEDWSGRLTSGAGLRPTPEQRSARHLEAPELLFNPRSLVRVAWQVHVGMYGRRSRAVLARERKLPRASGQG